MNIPEGFVLVPVEPTEEMLNAGIDQEWTKEVYVAMVNAAPAADINSYDESKERELFESWYGDLPVSKFKETMWMSWQACAKSRARSAE